MMRKSNAKQTEVLNLESCGKKQVPSTRTECSDENVRIFLCKQISSLGQSAEAYDELKSTANVNIDEGGTLTIKDIQKRNEGQYLCEAMNGMGSDLTSAFSIDVRSTLKLVSAPAAFRLATYIRPNEGLIICNIPKIVF